MSVLLSVVLSGYTCPMWRRLLCALAAIFLVSALEAQKVMPVSGETAGEELSSGEIFPLVLVLEGAEYAGDGCGAWRPDWPVWLPPDAFKVFSGASAETMVSGISRITLESEAVVSGEDFSLEYRRGPAGQTEEFPLMLNGRLAQVSLAYEGEEIREMTLSFPSVTKDREGEASLEDGDEEPWKLEFLEYRNSFPSLVRGFRGDGASQTPWYFIVLSRGGNEISETWYDDKGSFLGAYNFSLAEIGENQRIREIQGTSVQDTGAGMNVTELYYDSRCFLTESSGPDGVYKVQYFREDLPRYWERPPLKYTLQWDEAGFLVRIAAAETEGDRPVEYRYEYTLDERGNWVQRREIRMLRQSGLLIPSPGTTFRRVLEYR